MLAANYHAKNLDDMIPTHLNWEQQQALWHILKKHSILFSRKLGKLPSKPFHPKLTNFWMQKWFIQQHLGPLLYDIFNCKQLIVEIYKMTEVRVDLIGPWTILQRPSKSPKLSQISDVKQSLQVLALTMIDPRTNLLELIVVLDKESRTVDCTFNHSWLCCYQDPLSVFMTRNWIHQNQISRTPSILWNQGSNHDHSQSPNQCNP
jgi:hypothetical protein